MLELWILLKTVLGVYENKEYGFPVVWMEHQEESDAGSSDGENDEKRVDLSIGCDREA